MTVTECIEGLLELAPVALPDQSRFSNGWDAGYKRGLEAALSIAKAVES